VLPVLLLLVLLLLLPAAALLLVMALLLPLLLLCSCKHTGVNAVTSHALVLFAYKQCPYKGVSKGLRVQWQHKQQHQHTTYS
jgi:hypothetical protein